MDYFLNWNKYIIFVKEDMLAMEMLNISLNWASQNHKILIYFYFLLGWEVKIFQRK